MGPNIVSLPFSTLTLIRYLTLFWHNCTYLVCYTRNWILISGSGEKGQVGQVNSEGEEEADKAMPLVKDSQMLEFVRDLMTSVVSDFAVVSDIAINYY